MAELLLAPLPKLPSRRPQAQAPITLEAPKTETATTTMATTSTATPSEAPAGSSAASKAEAVVTAAQVAAGYRDFCALLDDDDENDPAACYHEAMEANGILVMDAQAHYRAATKSVPQEVPDILPIYAFQHIDSDPDLQAVSKSPAAKANTA